MRAVRFQFNVLDMSHSTILKSIGHLKNESLLIDYKNGLQITTILKGLLRMNRKTVEGIKTWTFILITRYMFTGLYLKLYRTY